MVFHFIQKHFDFAFYLGPLGWVVKVVWVVTVARVVRVVRMEDGLYIIEVVLEVGMVSRGLKSQNFPVDRL